jgi:hypothetical protein
MRHAFSLIVCAFSLLMLPAQAQFQQTTPTPPRAPKLIPRHVSPAAVRKPSAPVAATPTELDCGEIRAIFSWDGFVLSTDQTYLRIVQERVLGITSGTGSMGPRTRASLGQWQSRHNLEPSKEFDHATLELLVATLCPEQTDAQASGKQEHPAKTVESTDMAPTAALAPPESRTGQAINKAGPTDEDRLATISDLKNYLKELGNTGGTQPGLLCIGVFGPCLNICDNLAAIQGTNDTEMAATRLLAKLKCNAYCVRIADGCDKSVLRNQ